MHTARRSTHTGFGGACIGGADALKSLTHNPASPLRGESAPSS
ncbi:hypothetical protein [Lysobacter auxotrophicus]|nr:hypothetical protein [Lysobacter auxotrophicus]